MVSAEQPLNARLLPGKCKKETVTKAHDVTCRNFYGSQQVVVNISFIPFFDLGTIMSTAVTSATWRDTDTRKRHVHIHAELSDDCNDAEQETLGTATKRVNTLRTSGETAWRVAEGCSAHYTFALNLSQACATTSSLSSKRGLCDVCGGASGIPVAASRMSFILKYTKIR